MQDGSGDLSTGQGSLQVYLYASPDEEKCDWVRYSLKGSNNLGYFITFTDKIYVKIIGTDRGISFHSYELSAPAAVTLPIAITDLVYTKLPQILALAGQTADGIMEYSMDITNWTSNINDIKGTAAGTYKIYYRVKDIIDPDFITASIAKANPEYVPPTALTFEFKNIEQALIIPGMTNDGRIWYSINGTNNWIMDIPAATIAGTYTVYYKIVGDSNHNDNPGSFVIAKITPETVAVAVLAQSGILTYTGTPQIPVWEPYSSADITVNVSAQTDAGSYTAVANLTSAHYKWDDGTVGEKILSWTIQKADPVFIISPTAKIGLTCNGNEQVLIDAGETDGGTLEYKLDGGEWTSAIPWGINAGEYTVYYRITGDKNYNSTENERIIVSIAQENESPAIPDLNTEGNELTAIPELPISGSITVNGDTEAWFVFSGAPGTTILIVANAGASSIVVSIYLSPDLSETSTEIAFRDDDGGYIITFIDKKYIKITGNDIVYFYKC
jgi:hypothetical protein